MISFSSAATDVDENHVLRHCDAIGIGRRDEKGDNRLRVEIADDDSKREENVLLYKNVDNTILII